MIFAGDDSPIQFNQQLIKGHSWVWLMIMYNSSAANSIQLINEHYTRSMLSSSSWKPKYMYTLLFIY